MFGLGLTEIIILAIILILFFGGKKIPEFVKGITDAIREMKKGMKE